MAISARNNPLFSRLRTLFYNLEILNLALAGEGAKPRFYGGSASVAVAEKSRIDISTWKTVDSRVFGLTRSMISQSTWTVLKILQRKGFEAYLVGGCVRDLLLRRAPKDFDVITTANLKQIRKQFHCARIVGRRFPICLVHIQGSVIEVSSFETGAEHTKEKEVVFFSQIPTCCDEKDVVRWRNCMHRDFTINSLFYDPFVNRIYDYANGMKDLRTCKVRTIIPAQLSFKEDCARILRGLRIAARLGLSFSEETAEAIQNLSSSIMNLGKQRLMMELNYMLSYGAAESSLHLLWRFKLLDILLPVHAAYLAQQANNQSIQSSIMLMKLFFSMDELIACDRPSDSSMWVGLLAFHLALVNNPQDVLVVWAFASVLYYGNWREAVNCARKNALKHVQFAPEISEACGTKSDETLAEEVTHLASIVQSSLDALTMTESLLKSMARYPLSPCSGLVFISKKMGQSVAKIFDVLLNDIESYMNKRESFEIDYELLGKGDQKEIRFVLGKIIMDTMTSGIIQENQPEAVNEEKHCLPLEEKSHLTLPIVKQQWDVVRKKEKQCNAVNEEEKNRWEAVKEKEKYRQEVIKKERHPQEVGKMEKQFQETVKLKEKRCLEVVKEKFFQETLKEKKKLRPEVINKERGCQVGKEGKYLPEAVKEKRKHISLVQNPQQEVVEQDNNHLPLCNLEQQQEVVKEQEKRHQPLSVLFM